VTHRFFETEQFNFQTQLALGGVCYSSGDVGELLATVDRIVDGDADSWCQEWIATADRVAAIADGCADRGHQVSAAAAYLRASASYGLALSSVDGTKDPEARLLPTFRSHRRCFDAYVARLDPRAKRSRSPVPGPACPATSSDPIPPAGRVPRSS
jgi:hypothetical protein